MTPFGRTTLGRKRGGRAANASRKIIASSFERYNGGVRAKRQFGSSTLTSFYVYFDDDAKEPGKWVIVKGVGGKTPGERKSEAIRRSGLAAAPMPTTNAAARRAVAKVFAYYHGKVFSMDYVPDPKMRFKYAGMRVSDNAGDGYVIDGEKVYRISRSSRMSKIVTDAEERSRVLSEVAAQTGAPVPVANGARSRRRTRDRIMGPARRRNAPSKTFRVVSVNPDNLGGRIAQRMNILGADPSLTRAREIAQTEANAWNRTVYLVDDRFKLIRSYEPKRLRIAAAAGASANAAVQTLDSRTPSRDGVDVWFWFGELVEGVARVSDQHAIGNIPRNRKGIPAGVYLLNIASNWENDRHIQFARGPFRTRAAALRLAMPQSVRPLISLGGRAPRRGSRRRTEHAAKSPQAYKFAVGARVRRSPKWWPKTGPKAIPEKYNLGVIVEQTMSETNAGKRVRGYRVRSDGHEPGELCYTYTEGELVPSSARKPATVTACKKEAPWPP